MFGINTLTIEAKVELRLIQCDPYHTWTFLNPSLTFKSDHYFCVFLYSSAINFAIHLLSNSKSLVWYGSPCIGCLLGPRLHVILCPQHEKESAKPEIQKVVAHSPYLHQNGSLKKINWSLVVTFYMYVYLFYVLLVIHVGRLLMGSLEHENIWWMHM